MTAGRTIAEQQVFCASDRHLAGVVAGVLTYWLFAQSLINVIPVVQPDVAMASDTLSLAVSLSALFSGCFMVGCGSLADRFGHLRLTRIGLILSIAGSLLLAITSVPVLFFIARVLQGLSAACIMPATLALLKVWYDGAARQRAFSFWVIGSWGGSGLCAMTGGTIATLFGWRWIFVFSSLLAALSFWLLRDAPAADAPKKNQPPFDIIGLVLLVITLVLLNLLVGKGAGWSRDIVTGIGVALVSSAGLFLWCEKHRGESALIDFTLFRHRIWNAAALSNFLLNSCVGIMLITSLYLQQARGFSALQAGSVTLGYLVAVLAMIRIGEKLLQRFGARMPMVCGALLAGTGIAVISCTFLSQTTYSTAVIIGYLLFGIGLGCYATPSTDTAVSHAPAQKTATASGVYKMGSALGGAFGIAGSAALYTYWLPFGAENAAQWALWANTLVCALAAVLVFCVMPKRR